MQMIAIVVSLAFTVVAVALTVRAVRQMLATIRVGQAAPGRTDQPVARTLTMLKETVLHTRMLQWTWVGILHWFAFAAFIVLSTAVAAAFFQLFDPLWTIPVFGQWFVYEWIAEFLGLLGTLAIIPLIIYRVRNRPSATGRNSRFFGSTMWQAYFVEAMVLLESSAILFIRGAEFNLAKAHGGEHADHATGLHFPVSQFFGNLYPTGSDSIGTLENIIFFIAMVKIVSAMVWLIVISTNLTMGVAWHRFTAWFNIWFKREGSARTSLDATPLTSALGALKPLTSDGKPITLDDIDDLDEDSTLGVGSLEDFSWKGILDFTTCTECGRCQSQCPAWNTEKPLSPKLLMMGLREHAFASAAGEESATARTSLIGSGAGDEAQGAGTEVHDWFYNPEGADYVIDEDVLWSCTSCGACVQQCPVDIEHVDHIVDMRRYQVLVESNFPAELNGLFKGLENKGNPWNMSANARMDWAKDLPFDVQVVGDDIESLESVDWLFWVGCAGAYEDRAKKTTRAVAELLDMAGVTFGVLGNGETCTGDPARRAGNEFVFQGLAQQNVETFKEYKVKKVVSTCAHCFNTLKNEYKDFGIELEVVHHTQLLNRLVREGKLTPVKEGEGAHKRSITYHDPCYIGRHNGVYSPPRELLQVLPGAEFHEMERNSERSFCCGAGGARMWMEETLGERINVNRTKEAVGTGADQIAVGCPFCRVMLADGLTAEQADGNAREEVEVLDVAQMLLASVKGEVATKFKPGAVAPAAKSGSVATKAEPEAGDVTLTDDTVSKPADVGPNAKASGGGSLFDDAPAAPAPEAKSGGSLFDDAPAASTPEAKSGGSLFDEAPVAEQKSGGSLFDEGSGSLFDTPAPAAEARRRPRWRWVALRRRAHRAGDPEGRSARGRGPQGRDQADHRSQRRRLALRPDCPRTRSRRTGGRGSGRAGPRGPEGRSAQGRTGSRGPRPQRRWLALRHRGPRARSSRTGNTRRGDRDGAGPRGPGGRSARAAPKAEAPKAAAPAAPIPDLNAGGSLFDIAAPEPEAAAAAPEPEEAPEAETPVEEVPVEAPAAEEPEAEEKPATESTSGPENTPEAGRHQPGQLAVRPLRSRSTISAVPRCHLMTPPWRRGMRPSIEPGWGAEMP
ncbi:heterodisulfide reductase-related iron-sulfur binding cluster [Nocardioides alcanivorans]|uniref:heterodisulfide reductase-related iron-sulfur binding cluster n=1 Tax=Nocardioides alcanivorans TaxID=2897352 RepID=UPI001F32596E|nr:heterodisulfide reductase-related iron-sulfur binding cluster [Nocardioides alcanivorans]